VISAFLSFTPAVTKDDAKPPQFITEPRASYRSLRARMRPVFAGGGAHRLDPTGSRRARSFYQTPLPVDALRQAGGTKAAKGGGHGCLRLPDLGSPSAYRAVWIRRHSGKESLVVLVPPGDSVIAAVP
jgi:hypothetical protein